jgi:hypothetical protein
VVWEDDAYEGEPRFYKFNYFLSDKTVEVKELRTTNSGRDNFPMMLRRQKLAKEPILTHMPAMSLRREEYYEPQDLQIGVVVNVYGRRMKLLDCDPATKAWYATNLGMEMIGLPMPTNKPYLPPNPIPPYNGYGTEEDSLGNVHSLQPNAPKPDMFKMFENDMHIMRFEAKFVTTNIEDEQRNFVVSFFPSDDTVKVFEVVDRNAGIVGGKFMERRRFKNPYSEQNYTDRDFCIGRTVVLGNYRFLLTKADEYTNKYMESRPQTFPEAHVPSIIAKIVHSDTKYGGRQGFLIEFLRRIDSSFGR